MGSGFGAVLRSFSIFVWMRQTMIYTHVLDLGHEAHSPIDALDPKKKAPRVRQNCFASYARKVLAGETREVALGKEKFMVGCVELGDWLEGAGEDMFCRLSKL